MVRGHVIPGLGGVFYRDAEGGNWFHSRLGLFLDGRRDVRCDARQFWSERPRVRGSCFNLGKSESLVFLLEFLLKVLA